jgi:hypothetical protein
MFSNAVAAKHRRDAAIPVAWFQTGVMFPIAQQR